MVKSLPKEQRESIPFAVFKFSSCKTNLTREYSSFVLHRIVKHVGTILEIYFELSQNTLKIKHVKSQPPLFSMFAARINVSFSSEQTIILVENICELS